MFMTRFIIYNIFPIFILDKITLQVDGKPYGTVEPPQGGFVSLATECPKLATPAVRWKSGSLLAPFDEEVRIKL